MCISPRFFAINQDRHHGYIWHFTTIPCILEASVSSFNRIQMCSNGNGMSNLSVFHAISSINYAHIYFFFHPMDHFFFYSVFFTDYVIPKQNGSPLKLHEFDAVFPEVQQYINVYLSVCWGVSEHETWSWSVSIFYLNFLAKWLGH